MKDILGLILVFLALSSGSFLGATFLNKKYGEILPLTCFAIISVLYIFYIFDILLLGFWLVVFLIIACYCAGIIKLLKQKSQRFKLALNFFSPGMLVFAIFLLIIYFFTKDLSVLNYDELRLWASYPKALYYTNKLQFGNSALMLDGMNVYTPGIALFQYFVTKCILDFSEGYLFFAYAVLGFSIFMPLTKKMVWKKWYQIIVMLFIFLLAPLTFANSGFDGIYYYASLFIDPILGLIFGYSLFLSINNAFENNLKFILFLLSLIVLALLKDTGLILACIVYMSFFFNEIFIFKNNNYKLKLVNFNNYFKVFIPLLVICITFFSWNITKALNCNTHSFADSINVQQVLEGLFNPNLEQLSMRDKMITEMNQTPLVYTQYKFLDKYLTFKNFTILFFILILIIVLLEKNKGKAKYIFGGFSILFGLAIYSIAMLVFFIFGSKVVVCFQRYFCTYFMGMFIFIFLIIMNKITNNISRYKDLGVLLVILSLCIFSLRFPNNSQSGHYKDYDEISLTYSKKIAELIKNNGEQKLIILGGSNRIVPNFILTLYHHQILLDLMEYNLKTKWDTICLNENETKYEDIVSTVQQGGFNYLFIIIENEEDAIIASQCLKMDISESTLLKLEEINGTFQFIIVEKN